MNQPYNVMLLGRLRVEGGGDASSVSAITRFRTQKTALLLAFLVCHPDQLHARDALVELLWPEGNVDEGRVSLRTALASLRRQLEPPGVPNNSVLIADRTHVRLEPRCFQTDIARFEKALMEARRAATPTNRIAALRSALTLYTGPFLPGFYEDWVLIRRDHLSELHRQAVQQIVVDLGRSGDLPGALEQARNAVVADPQNGVFRETLEQLQAVADKPVRVAGTQLSVPVMTPTATETSETKELLPAEGNLTLPLTRFFGREEEFLEIQAVLRGDASNRILTLVGAGGTGKTRLALEVGHRLRHRYPGGVWFVPLAEARGADQIIPVLHNTLRLVAAPRREPVDSVIAALNENHHRPILVLFDNLEQIAAGASSVLMHLLRNIPHLECLITSRRRLAIPGEQVIGIAPLPIPLSGEAATPEILAQIASVQVFADRARACRPDFQITARNAPAVAGLCADLEGVPLALELAAAWSRTLSPAQMRERLGHRFALSTARSHQQGDRSERHQSLASTVAWSYDLLAPHQQRFLARLSIFRGGWTADAAQSVCSEPHALDLLALLSERSLIVSEETTTGDIRFATLETIREFAAEHIEADEHRQLQERHRSHFVAWVEALMAPGGRVTHPTTPNLERVERELPNLRSVFDTLSEDVTVREGKLRLFGALGNFWAVRGDWHEAWRYAQTLLGPFEETPATDRSDAPFFLARALRAAVLLARCLGKYTDGWHLLKRSQLAARRAKDLPGIAQSLDLGASISLREGDLVGAHQQSRLALRYYRRLNNASGMATVLVGLGNLAMDRSDLALSESHFSESLRLFRALDDRLGIANVLGNLANIAFHRGDMDVSRALRQESLDLLRELGDRSRIAMALDNLGLVAIEQNRLGEASELFDQAEHIHRRLGDRVSIAATQMNAATVAVKNGNLVRARELIEQTVALRRILDAKRSLAVALVNLGDIARQQKDIRAAQAATRESLCLFHSLGVRVGITFAFESIAELCSGNPASARTAVGLLGAADALRIALDYALPPSSVAEQEALRTRLRLAIGEAEYHRRLAEGSRMPLDEAVRLALEV